MKVLKNYLYSASYQVFLLMVPLITIPYISRVLGPQGVGINTLTNSTIQYFVLLANLGLSTYGQREIAYKKSDHGQLNNIFWEIEIISVLATLLSFLSFLFFLSFNSKYYSYYWAQSFLIIASALDVSWFFMGLENFKITVIRNFIFKIVTIILVFTFVRKSSDTFIYILIISVLTIISNLSMWPYLKRYVHKVSIKDLHVIRHIKPTVQLFIPQIAISVYGVLNKVMLGHISSVESSGYYDNSDKIIRICLALLVAFSTVMMPHVAEAFVNGEKEKIEIFVKRGIAIAISFSLPLMAGIIAIAPDFIPWFFGARFRPVISVISIEAVAILPISCATIVGAQYLVPLNRNNQYTISIICGALINVIINVPLIRYLSADGAAIATVIAETVVALVQIKYVTKSINLHKTFMGSYKPLVSSGILFIIVYTMTRVFPAKFIFILMEIVLGFSSYIVTMYVMKADLILDIKDLIRHKKI